MPYKMHNNRLESHPLPLYIGHKAHVLFSEGRHPKNSPMSILLTLILLLVMFLFTAAAIILVIGPLILLQPNLRTREWYATFTHLLEPADAGVPQEHLSITTNDGLKLDSWFVKQPRQARGTVVYLHGVGDCKIGGIRYAKLFYEQGLNVFLYDSRRHGLSEGKYCTYGYYEKHDVSTVIDYLMTRGDTQIGKIGLFGTSMGAAVALQAAATDDRIAAIVAEASFTNLRTIMVDYQKRIIKLPWHFLRNVAMSQSQAIAKFKAREVSPIESVHKVHKPILFIHGTDDSRIKTDYSKALYDSANEPKELLLVPEGDHTDLLNVGGSEYERRITAFFRKYLG